MSDCSQNDGFDYEEKKNPRLRDATEKINLNIRCNDYLIVSPRFARWYYDGEKNQGGRLTSRRLSDMHDQGTRNIGSLSVSRDFVFQLTELNSRLALAFVPPSSIVKIFFRKREQQCFPRHRRKIQAQR